MFDSEDARTFGPREATLLGAKNPSAIRPRRLADTQTGVNLSALNLSALNEQNQAERILCSRRAAAVLPTHSTTPQPQQQQQQQQQHNSPTTEAQH